MGRSNILKLVVLFVVLVQRLQTKGQWIPRPPITPQPLCGSQFVLASHACSLLPYFPSSPPSPSEPPSPPSPDEPDEGHHRRHGHRHRRHRHHAGSPVEQDCCKWLREIDSECVCELLVRLPVFLSRPAHLYTVTVGEACNITYHCGSRIIN